MSEQYLHTLIPGDTRFVPAPGQAVQFLDGLFALRAAPLNWKLILMKPSGRMRQFTNPLTGEVKSVPANDRLTFEKAADLNSAIESLERYSVALDGEGPPTVPAFALYFKNAPFVETYGYAIRCCLKDEPVSMSCLGYEQTENELSSFGKPYVEQDALFRLPDTGELIKVAGAGCARFWIEFEFGKWLLPKFDHSLELMNPSILALATQSFSLTFKQGFHLY